MRKATFLAFVAGLTSIVSVYPDTRITKDTVVHFASTSEGRRLLTTRDDFIHRLSPFDRSARMKVDRQVQEEEFLGFIGKNVSDWTEADVKKLEGSLEHIAILFRDRSLPFPVTIQLIKSTGAEEGNAAYTRGTAIVIPQVELGKSREELEKLVCHELFHVLTRTAPDLRRKLYAIIGFAECEEVIFPPELAPRKITNPDAPRNDHFISVQNDGHQSLVIPILFANAQSYDVKRGGEFFDYLKFQFLAVEKAAKPGTVKVIYENGFPKLIEPQAVTGFLEQVGKNTQYIIHPEEILADNFALLVLAEQNPPSPEVLHKMEKVLFGTR